VSETIVVHEIYLSLQGESTWAGLPCVFIRLTGCNLRCSYCDTAYAFTGGQRQELSDVLAQVHSLAKPYATGRPGLQKPLVELTGGEPLLQKGCLPLMTQLCNAGYTVLIETSGACDIAPVDPRVHRIMDLKCPSSGEVQRNRWENLPHLRPSDEIKFVIGTREDYAWAREQLDQYALADRCPILFSWVSPLELGQQHPSLRPVPADARSLSRADLVAAILADHLPVRFQLQMHKFIWPPDARGV
jgi:7-carboxy-7-deazaguanine synthase